MMKKHVFIMLIIGLVVSAYSTCFAAKRALVIGNGDYQYAPLKNPVNDARAMAVTLEELGFSVMKLTDATQKEMEDAIREFGRRVDFNDVALFYFSGHGIQMDGVNFLVPVGADIFAADEIKYKAVPANLINGKLEDAGSRVNIIILDACRNNPFKSFRSLQMGLATMSAAKGTLIAYSTSPDDVALDGDGENSPYTTSLLRAMKTPGLTIEKVFKTVRIAVMEETDERQVPWESSSLTGDFYFLQAPTPVPTTIPPTPTPLPVPTQTPTQMPFELRLLQKAQEYLQNQQYVSAFELFKEFLQENSDSAEGRAGIYELLDACKTRGETAYQQNDPQTMQEYYRLYLRIARYAMSAFGTNEFQQDLLMINERLNPKPTATPAPTILSEPTPTPVPPSPLTPTPQAVPQSASEPEFHFDDFIIKNRQGKVMTSESGQYTLHVDESIELTAQFTAVPPRELGVSWTTGRGKISPNSRFTNVYTATRKGGDYITVYIWDTETGEEVSGTISVYVQ